MADKGFLLAGATGVESNPDTSGDFNILIIRIDSLGRQKWAKTYKGFKASGVSGLYSPFALVDLMMTTDGNVLIFSSTGGNGATGSGFRKPGKSYLIKINLNGSVLWSKIFPLGNGAFTKAADRGFVMITSFLDIDYSHSTKVLKIDNNGNVEWLKEYADPSHDYTETPFHIINSIDGGYLICGQFVYYSNKHGFMYFIKKIDSNGTLIWTKNYYSSTIGGNFYIYSIQEISDGSIYVCGYAEGEVPCLIKTDKTGKTLWAKLFDNLSLKPQSKFLSVLFNQNNNIFNITFSAYPGTYQRIGVLRIDTSGKIIFNKMYGTKPSADYNSNYLTHDLVQLPNGGYIFLQSTRTNGAGGADFYLVKTDNNGNTNGCNFSSYNFSISPINIISTSYTNNVITSYPNATSGCTVASIAIKDTFTCPPMVAGFGWLEVCYGQTTIFTDSSYYNAIKWYWDFGDGTKSTKQSPFHKYADTGQYKVTLIASNGIQTDTVAKIITIYSMPVAFNFDTLICAGNVIKLKTNGNFNYKWRPGTLLDDSTSPNPSSLLKKTTTFIVHAYSDSSCAVFDTIHITVDPKPNPPLIKYATVVSNSEIDLHFQKSDSSDVKSYYIYRSENGGVWQKIAAINNLSNNDTNYNYNDIAISARSNNYAYKIVALDSCGETSDSTSAHQPVLLKINRDGCQPNLQLNWTLYSGWKSVKKQLLYRSVNGGTDSILAVLGNTIKTYNDSGLDHRNLYCYKILSYDNAGSFISASNQVCARVFFPDTTKVIAVSKISTSLTSGSVVVRWKSFNKQNLAYNKLFYSADDKNYILLNGHLAPNVDSFVQNGLNTQTADQYYYLVTVDSCGQQSANSVIHKTMTLTVSVGQLLHKLNWTPYYGYKVKSYKVERFESGQFKDIDSVPGTDTSSKEFPAPCNFAIRYRIAAVGYDSGEVSWSDTMGRQAIDTIPSDLPVLLTATAVNNISSRIDFKGSDSLDTYEYAVQRSVDGNWATAGTILFNKPGELLSYLDTGINNAEHHLCYTVVTLDSCLNASPSDTFCLIQLTGKALDNADSLRWYPFKGYDLQKYSLLRYSNSGQWDTLVNLNPTDTGYFHVPLPCSVPVSYKIAANEAKGNRLTFSDSITLTPFDTIKPPAPVLYYATVLPDQSVKLSWQWNPISDVKFFEVWRSINNAPPVLLKTVIYDSVYIDKVPNPKSELYSYHIIAIDSCNMLNRSQPSHWDTLMTLKLHSLFCKKQVRLDWTPYKGLPNGVNGYEIYRSTDGMNFTQIASLKSSANVFIDTAVQVGIPYFYKIKATDTLSAQAGKSGYYSYSDTLSTIPRIIPEADSAQIVYATVLKTDAAQGKIYVQWKRAPLNDTNARGYYLYSYDVINGKYTLLQDITDLNDTTYVHSGLNTLGKSYHYYVLTYNVCEVGANSIIHKTVLLSVTNGNLKAMLNWSYYLGVGVKYYSIYKSKDGSPQYLLKDAGQDTTYNDSNLNCHHSYTYQIQAVLDNGKISFSDSVTVKATDTIIPVTAPIIWATVTQTGTANGKILLQWNSATDKNLQGYTIYRSSDGISWFPITKAYPGTQIIDSNASTYTQPYYYKIQPVDSCGNFGQYVQYHKTIHLKALAGNQSAQLYWNAYEGWKVKRYEIYRNGSLVATTRVDTTTWIDTTTVCGQEYQYQIKAFADTTTDTLISWSNTDSIRARDSKPPQGVYIKTVTVSNPNKAATITWTTSPSFDTKNYYIYRKSGRDGNMQLIDSTINTSYVDSSTAVKVPLGVWGEPVDKSSGVCYYIFARDHCSNISPGSNLGCIIYLNAQNQPGYNDLNWNGYEHWYDGVQSYNVYKNEDNTGWNLIGTTSPLLWGGAGGGAFTDKSLGDSTINYCYQVEAVENPGQYNQLSRSTVVCVHQDATVFIPNTFSPFQSEGLNDYFAPKGLHIKSYSMRIYNRWGELVFDNNSSTLDRGMPAQGRHDGNTQGWDGNFKGKDALEGVYIYLITIEDYNGHESYFKGNVTVLK